MSYRTAALSVMGLIAPAALAQVAVTTIARDGQSAFGLGGDWANTSFRFDVNASGQVSFIGLSSIADADGVASDGVFVFDPSSGLSLIVRDDTAAAPGASYAGFLSTQIAADGTVFYQGFLRNAGGSAVNNFNNEFLANSAAGIVAREGSPSDGGTTLPTPDGDVYLAENVTLNNTWDDVFIDGSGGFVFSPGANTDAFRASDDTQVFGLSGNYWRQLAGGSATLALDLSDTPLPGNLRLGFSTNVTDMNDAGQLVFGARVLNADGTAPGSTSDSAIYIQNADGTFTEVVRATGSTAADSIDNLEGAVARLDAAGNAFFTAQRRVNQDNRGLYTNIGGFTRIARLGAAIAISDGMGGTDFAEIVEFHDPLDFAVGRDGEVAFRARAQEIGFPNAERNAIFRWDNGAITEVFTEGDDVLGLPGGFSVDLDIAENGVLGDGMQLNGVGTLAFIAELGISDDALIVSLEEGDNILVAGEGLLFAFSQTEDKLLSDILSWGLDDANRITLNARFVDGTVGLYSIAVPAPGTAAVALVVPLALLRRRR